jgi:hypothetical protein
MGAANAEFWHVCESVCASAPARHDKLIEFHCEGALELRRSLHAVRRRRPAMIPSKR